MKKMLPVIVIVLMMLASCAETYNVQGTSSVSALDGNTMYLKVVKDGDMKVLDSCDIVHGQFTLSGVLDTVRLGNLYLGDESLMPLVVEQGNIIVKIDNALQTVGGTPHNETLYEFIKAYNQLDARMAELSRRQSQMLLEGIAEDIINQELLREAEVIADEEDKLVTTFIEDNFDNVLGPGIFMMLTSTFRYPVLTPQIEVIMNKATDKFKNDPYVSDYYRRALENEASLGQ